MSEATQATAGEVVQGMIGAVMAMDLDALQAVIHPQAEVIEPENLPYGGIYKGADAFFNDLFPQIAGPFDLAIADPEVIDGGDVAAVRMKVVFTSKRTGEEIRMPYVEVYEITDSKIVRIDVYPQDVTALTAWMDANR